MPGFLNVIPLVVASLAMSLIHTANSAVKAEPAPDFNSITAPDNPLLGKWQGPYGGVPPFDEVQVVHFAPALEAAMAENLAEVEAIASDPAMPTFENTIVALEKSGATLDRVFTSYGVWSSTMSDDAFQAVEREVEPRLAAFSDQITQNAALFSRIESVYNNRDDADLTPEQERLTWLYYTNFVRAGAQLDDASKERLSEINQRLAELYTSFSQNVLGDEDEYFVVLESEDDLAGLPGSVRDAASAAAEARGMPGKWLISNTRSSADPFLTYSDRRDLRQKVWEMWVNRGDMGGERDNNAIIAQILKLRAERADLLGYETHAHWRLENQMASTPERALALLEEVWVPAVARVESEVAEMQELAAAAGEPVDIQPWDYRYYMEKVRKEKYDLDNNEVKEYLQLENLREGMFWVAGELFGFAFSPIDNVPVYHPDVRVWEVTDRDSGKLVGLWYFDPYARTGKRSGAWMNAYRRQHELDGSIPTIVSNNANFVKGRPGEPVLISWDDAETLFHEFGHALHGLSSEVTYPSLSGTAVPRDYVEFPSQLLEHWLSTPEVLQQFALHYETGEPIPQQLVDRIKSTSAFRQGFDTVEYLASAIVDMRLHLAGNATIDPDAFERETLAEIGVPKQIVMRHRTPQFMHVFSGDSYSASYYSYLWADVITADAFEAFTESGGPYDEDVASRLIEHVFSVGNTIDPAEGYRAFRGRDAQVDALMRDRGFVDLESTEQ